MASTRPTTVDEYIQAAPAAGQPHLRRIRAILKKAAPKADEVIKWGNPFFIEPRFLFAYSAHKAHLSFAPGETALVEFAKELAGHDTTKNFLKIPYNKPLPEDLIRKIAEYRVRVVSERTDDSFW
ncbi:MAG: DUF1801 domain-containing protein [Rhodoferax sp.]|nr:DUF1801 domain-containing protein [Rhodoferax sp.]